MNSMNSMKTIESPQSIPAAGLLEKGAWLFAFVLFLPRVDAYLDERMSYHLIYQVGGLLLAGVLTGWLRAKRHAGHSSAFTLKGKGIDIRALTNPGGVSGLIFFLGTLLFWMIPRSVDLAVLDNRADYLMQANLFIAGYWLGQSLRRMPFVLKTAAGIYGLAMFYSMSHVYENYGSLLCAAYDLEMQKETGRRLFFIFPLLFLLFLILSARNLVRFAYAQNENQKEKSDETIPYPISHHEKDTK